MRRWGAIAGLAGLGLLTAWAFWAFLGGGDGTPRRILLVGGLSLVVVGVVARRRAVLEVVRGRRLRIGAQSVIYTIVVTAVLLMINFVAARNRFRVDLTEGRSFSLTPVSERIVGRVGEPLKIIGFFTAEQKSQMRAARGIYELYADANPQITYELVDPLRSPAVPSRYGVSGSDITLVECGDRVRSRAGFTQTIVTNLIASVSGGQRTALFMQGSGMRDPRDGGPDGYNQMARVLRDALFEISSDTLTPGRQLEPDAFSLVILPGPEQPLEDFEVEQVHDYLIRGGKVLAFVDPVAPGRASPLETLAERWGIQPLPGVVAQVNDADLPWYVYATDFGDARAAREVREKMNGRRVVFDRPGPLALVKAEDPRIYSGSLAPLHPDRDPVFLVPEVRAGRPNREGETLPFPEGEISLVSFAYRDVVLEGKTVGVSRVVVLGDADFGDNYTIDLGDNRRFLSALVSWLTGEELVVEEEAGEGRKAVAWGSYRRPIAVALILPPLAVMLIGAGVLSWRKWR